ncbi:MAG: hypothetical protein IPL06_18710 [Betaproteobacteria bacterium]|nr:hypothetical protein [Betaproteobacteria bacterium]
MELRHVGQGSPSHLEMELIRGNAGSRDPGRPYKEFQYRHHPDTIAVRVSCCFLTFPAALPHIKGGKVRALAVGSPERAPQAPDIPTIAEELGVPGYEVSVWYGVVAPAGTPAEIVSRLNTEIAKALEVPAVRERIVNTGAVVSYAPTDKFNEQIRAETTKWTKLVKEHNRGATHWRLRRALAGSRLRGGPRVRMRDRGVSAEEIIGFRRGCMTPQDFHVDARKASRGRSAGSSPAVGGQET